MTAEAILCLNGKEVLMEVGWCRDEWGQPGGVRLFEDEATGEKSFTRSHQPEV